MDPRAQYPGHWSSIIPSVQDKSSRVNTKHILLIDARDRISGSAFDFRVNLNERLEQVTNVKLLGACVPKTSDMYSLLTVAEFQNSTIDTSNVAQTKAVFAPLIYDSSTSQVGDIKSIKGFDFGSGWEIQMNPPLPKLDRLSVSITRPNGTPLTASDTANVTTAVLLFEINTCSRTV